MGYEQVLAFLTTALSAIMKAIEEIGGPLDKLREDLQAHPGIRSEEAEKVLAAIEAAMAMRSGSDKRK